MTGQEPQWLFFDNYNDNFNFDYWISNSKWSTKEEWEAKQRFPSGNNWCVATLTGIKALVLNNDELNSSKYCAESESFSK